MRKNESVLSKISLIFSMLIFGTIGIFKKSIPLPSGTLAMFRGLIGAVFLILLTVLMRKKINFSVIKKNLFFLVISGALIGFNWILLFESYNYTSVASSTLCYYMAPVFVIFASPVFLKEKLTVKQTVCSFLAIFGMILVSGVLEVGFKNINEFIGVFLALGAALLYASVIIMNKKMSSIGAFEKTIIQLMAAGTTIIPYSLIFENINTGALNHTTILLVLVVGLLHTGIAYALYFSSFKNIKAQTAAIYSYIDPIFAILLSVFLLREKMSILAIIGSIIVLGSTLICELNFKKRSV